MIIECLEIILVFSSEQIISDINIKPQYLNCLRYTNLQQMPLIVITN